MDEKKSDQVDDDKNRNTYLGFDFSTQQVKAVEVGPDGEVRLEEHVQFDSDLPEYRTQGGVHMVGKVVTAPTVMWVKALDMLMEKLRIAGIDFDRVAALSGCGQQHGTVYWRIGASEMLGKANPDKFLHDELAHAFSVQDSPVWMDSSTTSQCQNLEERVGGPQALANLTGSRAYERFSGPQVSKICCDRREAYNNTERISLVSSFACSLFLGKYAPIDLADAGGTNLLDIRSKKWDPDCLKACAPDLSSKLGEPTHSSTVTGTVSHYMVERYGFRPECKVITFTGDNPAALAGMQMGPSDIGLSLGTSDTVFVWLGKDEISPQRTGHIWNNPVDEDAYMALLCYKNGSLTRERICKDSAEGDWDIFSQLLDSTPRGNFGNIGFYFDLPEIIPAHLCGDFRFSKNGERVARFASAEAEVRALTEGQFMAKRIHAEQMGMVMGPESRILVCGGASRNKAILQVVADVFNVPVFSRRVGSAAYGCALRAREIPFRRENLMSYPPVCVPHKDAAAVYKPLLERYKTLEERIVNCQQDVI